MSAVLIAATLTGAMVSQAAARRLGAFSNLPLIGSGGGTSFSLRCPDNYVLTGIRARVGSVVDGMGIRCSRVLSTGLLGTSEPKGLMAGGNGGTFVEVKCGGVVMGQRGGSLGVGIDRLRIYCANWVQEVKQFSGGQPKGHNIRMGAGLFVDTDRFCPFADQPAVGIYGRHGSIVDSAGLICDYP